MNGAGRYIDRVLRNWEGVEVGPWNGRIVEYFIGRRQVGHVHGDVLVDIPFPKKLRDEIVTDGRGSPHHHHPETGWVSVWVRSDADLARAIDLLRLSYEMAIASRERIRQARARAQVARS